MQSGLRGLADDRSTAERARPAVGDGASDLLLEREEEAGRHDEHEDPEPVERRVLRLGEALERQDLEAVRGDAGDQQAEADGVGAFGHWQLASGLDESLCALRHALSRSGPGKGGGAGAPAARRVSISARPRRSGYQQTGPGREDWPRMSTRTLLILAALTGVAILTAGAVQILLAR